MGEDANFIHQNLKKQKLQDKRGAQIHNIYLHSKKNLRIIVLLKLKLSFKLLKKIGNLNVQSFKKKIKCKLYLGNKDKK